MHLINIKHTQKKIYIIFAIFFNNIASTSKHKCNANEKMIFLSVSYLIIDKHLDAL